MFFFFFLIKEVEVEKKVACLHIKPGHFFRNRIKKLTKLVQLTSSRRDPVGKHDAFGSYDEIAVRPRLEEGAVRDEAFLTMPRKPRRRRPQTSQASSSCPAVAHFFPSASSDHDSEDCDQSGQDDRATHVFLPPPQNSLSRKQKEVMACYKISSGSFVSLSICSSLSLIREKEESKRASSNELGAFSLSISTFFSTWLPLGASLTLSRSSTRGTKRGQSSGSKS